MKKSSGPVLVALKCAEKHFVSGLFIIININIIFLFLSSLPFLMPRNAFP